IESLDQVGDVTVTGAGTLASPWIITILQATTGIGGQYARFATHYNVQSYVGSLLQRDDTRVSRRFYRLSDSSGEYMFETDGDPATADMPVLIERATPAGLIGGNRVQFISLKPGETGPQQDAVLWYGNEGVVIRESDTATLIKARLEHLLNDVTEVEVLGAGTVADPWSIEFLNAVQDNGKYRPLEITTGGGSLDASLRLTRTQSQSTTAAGTVNDRQILSIPTGTSKIRLSYNGETTSVIDLVADNNPTTDDIERISADLETALEALTGITSAAVVAVPDENGQWAISLLDAATDGAGAFYTLSYQGVNVLSTDLVADALTESNSRQVIRFDGATRGVLTYGSTKIALTTSMSLSDIGALLSDQLRGDTGGSSVAVTGTPGNWTISFTALRLGQEYRLMTFTVEQSVTTPAVVSLTPSLAAGRVQQLVRSENSAFTVFYGNTGIDLNNSSVTAAELKAALESSGAVTRVEITGQGTALN
ncbi:MAG: hypothetical protein ACK50J_03585, partial [Planctomyces sp.]